MRSSIHAFRWSSPRFLEKNRAADAPGHAVIPACDGRINLTHASDGHGRTSWVIRILYRLTCDPSRGPLLFLVTGLVPNHCYRRRARRCTHEVYPSSEQVLTSIRRPNSACPLAPLWVARKYPGVAAIRARLADHLGVVGRIARHDYLRIRSAHGPFAWRAPPGTSSGSLRPMDQPNLLRCESHVGPCFCPRIRLLVEDPPARTLPRHRTGQDRIDRPRILDSQRPAHPFELSVF